MRPHDPGPWHARCAISYDGKIDPNAFDIVADNGQKVARGYWGGEANMRLASAAPELRDALRAVLGSALVSNGNHDPFVCTEYSCRIAREALAKAEGESDGND